MLISVPCLSVRDIFSISVTYEHPAADVCRNKAPASEVQRAVSKLDLSGLDTVSAREDLCSRLYPSGCDAAQPYRSLDGSCNNVQRPSWGKALSCHNRIAPPVYQDGTCPSGAPLSFLTTS
ncbi:hypothetical protein HPB48_019475 [Haemaphysalis longicornis]|uniref:Uncharacterized protein n=1 Tax=Haemaphysalis longicornis TaxID=44386 RepID=A0A9J6FLU3_HAELO|nr:hypothetical protein HPB48_019475 [Haemaphysalis longicornis]